MSKGELYLNREPMTERLIISRTVGQVEKLDELQAFVLVIFVLPCIASL